MKRRRSVVGIVGVLLTALAFTTAAVARGGSGRGAGIRYMNLYDPATVQTIEGVVASVDRMAAMEGMPMRGGAMGRKSMHAGTGGIHLMVKATRETIAVHLGPALCIDDQGIWIELMDEVTMRGSRITYDGKPAIVAAELRLGEKVLKLRDESGIPVWQGGPPRRP